MSEQLFFLPEPETGMSKEDIWSLWVDMPEYNNVKESPPEITALFKFRSEEDFLLFNDLIKEHVYKCGKVFDGMQRKTEKQAWFPLRDKGSNYEYK